MATRYYQVARRLVAKIGAAEIDVPEIKIPEVNEACQDAMLSAVLAKARRHAQRIFTGSGYPNNEFAPLAFWVRRNVTRDEAGVLGPDEIDAIQRFARFHDIYNFTDKMFDRVLGRVIRKAFKEGGWGD